jgi:phosphoribosylanthranilate isomerase
MIVKVCGITRPEDAEAAVEAGASALGFVFAPGSPRCITPERAAVIGSGLAVWKVGVFVDETAASIEAVMRAARLDVAQLYGGEAPDGARVWRAFRIGGADDRFWSSAFSHADSKADDQNRSSAPLEALLLDGATNGQSFDWALARGLADKIIVAGGLDASNVADAIRAAQPWGVDASSGLESAPGVKDHEKVRRFVEAALAAG